MQECLLERSDEKPQDDFLKQFSGIVGSNWSILPAVLSLSDDVIKEMIPVPEEGESMVDTPTRNSDRAFQMLEKWRSRDDATYGQLCQRLKTIKPFKL